eukprot:jgi/Botrbrau1/18234/Bobra.53_1s0088.1
MGEGVVRLLSKAITLSQWPRAQHIKKLVRMWLWRTTGTFVHQAWNHFLGAQGVVYTSILRRANADHRSSSLPCGTKLRRWPMAGARGVHLACMWMRCTCGRL